MENENILYEPFTIERCTEFVNRANAQGKGIIQIGNVRYALRENEIVVDGNIVVDEDYEEKQQQYEAERIANLSLTKRDVFLALYKDKGITPEQIKAQIQDPEALIEFEYASSYYRGNPLIDAIGQALGYTKEQLDYLFEHKELPVGE